MTRSDVVDSLTKWRDAVRDAERAPMGTYERTIAESYAERLHQDYLRAVLRMTGRQEWIGRSGGPEQDGSPARTFVRAEQPLG